MNNRNINAALKRTSNEILNNTLIYIPVLLLLIYAGNKYYGIELLKGLSSIIPTVLAIFVSTILSKKIIYKQKNIINSFVAIFILGATIGLALQLFLILISIFNLQFNLATIIFNIILSGLGAAFFTIYDYDNVYKKEYRNIFVTLIMIFTIMIVMILKVSFETTLSLGLLLGAITSFIIFNYNHTRNINYSWLEIRKIISQIINKENIKTTPKHYIQVLPALLIPYIVLASNGFVTAGLLSLLLVIITILFIIWNSVKRNMLLTHAGYPKINSKNFRRGLEITIIATILMTLLTTVFSQQIMSIFMIPIEYSTYFSTLGIITLPIMLSLIIIVLFYDVQLIKNQPLELTLTIILAVGTILLSRYQQLQLGTTIFMLYTVFISWVIIKTSNFKG